MNSIRVLVVCCVSLPLVLGCLAQKSHVSRANLPVIFEPVTSADHSTEMIGRASGAAVLFKPSSLVLSLPGDGTGKVEITFFGSRTSNPNGVDPLRSQTNYLLGNDQSQWRTHVPNYGKVSYGGLYRGIDAVFYGNGRQMEHDFIVAPGADYHRIRMHIEGARARHGREGSLALALDRGAISFARPIMYQEQNGKRLQRRGAFRIYRNGDVGFTVEGYDSRLPLVIDPVLSFATYLSQYASDAEGVATDSNGDSYVTGYAPLGYPVTAGVFSGCGGCSADVPAVFVSKLSADGSTLIYSTLLGGNSFAQATGIATDSNGDAIVTGFTGASNFPTKNGQPILPESNNYVGFLTSLSPDGSSLKFGTLLGPSPTSTQASMTYAMAVAVDSSNNVYVTGETGSGFPVTSGALNQGDANNEGFDVFVAKFGSSGSLLYSAVIGDADPQNGGGGPIGGYALAVDADGSAYVAGQAGSLWPISSNAYLKQIGGSAPYADPFVTKVAPDATSLVYSTYLDSAYVITGISALANGNVIVAGNGVGPNHPTTANAYQAGSAAGGEAFLTELNATGSGLVYATALGDSSYSVGGMALDPGNQTIWIAAETGNAQFPLVTPLQSTFPLGPLGFPGKESVVSQFDPTGETLTFSTFLGGTATGYGSSVTVDTQHRVHVGGAAVYGMYTTPGAYAPQVPQPGQGYTDATYAYVALIDPTIGASAACISPNSDLGFQAAVGTSQQEIVTVTSCGTQPLTVTGASTGSAVFTVPSAGDTCTQALPVGQSCTLTVIYTPTAVRTDTSTLTINSNASISDSVITLTGFGSPQSPVLLAPTSISFASQAVGTTSTAQTVVLTNTGTGTLSGLVLLITGTNSMNFAETSNCTASVAPGISCSISVTFTPPAPGSFSATLTVVDDVAGSPQTVSLAGSAPQEPLSLGPASSASTGSTVTSGQPASYALLVNSAIGYSGTVSFTCTSLPVNASCSFSPTSLALSGGQPQAVTVTVATVAGSIAVNHLEELPLMAALLFLPLINRYRHPATWRISIMAFTILASLCLTACGGGSSSMPTSNKVPAGTYNFQVVASDGVNQQSQTLTLIVQ